MQIHIVYAPDPEDLLSMASVKSIPHNTNKENKKQSKYEDKGKKKTATKAKQNASQHDEHQVVNSRPTIVSRRSAGCNWQLAAATPTPTATATATAEPAATTATAVAAAATTLNNKVAKETADVEAAEKAPRRRKRNKWGNRHVAMDCEMVGIGEHGEKDMLARVSIVNRHGKVLLDKYVKPREQVVDYRTSVSGIRPADIEQGEDFDTVQNEVVNLLQGRVLVGHGLRKDMIVLQIKHPYINTRDTSCYKPLARLVANGRTPSLKRLVHCLLGEHIQTGEHDSVEDARAAMNIYNRCSEEWEKYLQRKAR